MFYLWKSKTDLVCQDTRGGGRHDKLPVPANKESEWVGMDAAVHWHILQKITSTNQSIGSEGCWVHDPTQLEPGPDYKL